MVGNIHNHNNITTSCIMGPGKKKLAACLSCDKDGLGRRAGVIYHNDMGGGTTEQHGGALGFAFFLFLYFAPCSGGGSGCCTSIGSLHRQRRTLLFTEGTFTVSFPFVTRLGGWVCRKAGG
jgi:hypothetical protein